MKRYTVGDCEMLERKQGNYIKVNDVLAWLDDLTDDDNPEIMQEKIEQLTMELGDI